MTADYYLSQFKIYSRFARNYNPAQQDLERQMLKIAVGPNEANVAWTEGEVRRSERLWVLLRRSYQRGGRSLSESRHAVLQHEFVLF